MNGNDCYEQTPRPGRRCSRILSRILISGRGRGGPGISRDGNRATVAAVLAREEADVLELVEPGAVEVVDRRVDLKSIQDRAVFADIDLEFPVRRPE